MRRLNGNWFYVLQDEAGKPAAGGGNGGGGGTGGNAGGAPDIAAQLAAQTKRNDELEARLKTLEGGNSGGGKPAPDPKDSADLAAKAKAEREAAEQTSNNERRLESALKFNLGSTQWLKDNASLLPKSIEGIFTAAAKENYANAIEKDSAIKAGIVSEFFSQQANVDRLTAAQKVALEDFNKLTKNVKQERAQSIYDTLFEPALETLKLVKKAEQLNKGIANPTDVEAGYKSRLIAGSRKHYLGDKQNGS